MAIKYGGKTTPDYSAMRGPCDTGFHVPMESERQIIKTAVETWWSGNGAGQVMALASYLKIPLGGYLARTTGALSGQGNWGTYWMCTSPTSSQGRSFDIQSSSISFSNSEKGLGQSIRPFKDMPVVPDSNWTVEHQGTGTAGIYSNSTLGLISISSDGENWVTIADKNIGATTVYSYVDTLSETNCGYFFQRGNNYGFPYTGAVTTSGTAVSTTGYGPGNYYSSSTFIKQANRSSPTNYNLRGGVTGVQQKPAPIKKRYYGGKLVDDYSAMRGPCDEGFHIPTRDEWDAVLTAGATIGAWIRTASSGQSSVSAYPCRYYLKIPRMDYISNTGEMVTASRFSWVSYHISTANSTGLKGRYVGVIGSYGNVPATLSASINSNCHGYPIRPFKDGAVIPDNTWTMTYDGSSTATGAGIFYNSSLGLISISSDGTTRYTLADRDIGASEAYDKTNGAIQVGAKGKVFQRGNNYGFTTSETFATGTDIIDPTGYGPGNYYYNTTFTTGGNMYSTGNSNLRGGDTGVQQKPTKVIEVYYGSTKIRPSYPAGIYWNPNIDGGVISISSNGTDWLTLADKNLGATTVYNLGDTMSEANCGKFYQRGNNYGFSYTGTPSISSTKVDVSSYGPNNYYSDSTFRRVSYSGNWRTDASTTAAFNLWGGVTGTAEAAQGPCPNGFHIPSRSDITNLVSMYIGLDILSDTDSQAYLKIPRMGIRDNYNATVNDAGTDGGFRSCTINTEPYESTYYPYACECWNQSQYQIQLSTGHMNSYCLGIRPFRNEAIMPDDTRVAILN